MEPWAIPTVLCPDAPVDGPPVLVAPGDPCPYCGDPMHGHVLAGADTKDVRRIDTDAGTIIGSVDRALRKVVWHLECPECETPIAFTDDTFTGRAAVVCECGWKSRHVGHKERSEAGGIYAYYDYSTLAFGDVQGSGAEGTIHAGMTF